MADLVTLLMQRADRGEPVGADEIIARLESRLAGRDGLSVVDDEAKTVSPQRSGWRRPLAVAAAAFVVVISIGGVLWLIGPAEPNDVVDPTTTTTPVTTVTTTIPVTTTVPVPTTVAPIDKVEWPWGRFLSPLVSIGQGRMFMFGGGTEIAIQRSDTWILDLESLEWRQESPENPPHARAEHAAFYDPVGHQVFVFGGAVGATVVDELWVYNVEADTWTSIESSEPVPEARAGASMVYIDSIGKAILYGGSPFYDVETAAIFSDTWLFDPATYSWTEVTHSQSPSPRAYAGVAYATRSDKVVLVGGIRDPNAGDSVTWVFDPATLSWSERSDSPTLAAELEARNWTATQEASVGYVPAVDRVVAYQVGAVAAYDVDADAWTPVVRAPADLIGVVANADPTFGQFVMFGGLAATQQLNMTIINDLYILAPDLSAWTKVPSPS